MTGSKGFFERVVTLKQCECEIEKGLLVCNRSFNMLRVTFWNRAGGSLTGGFISDLLDFQWTLLNRDGQGEVLLDRDGELGLL